MFYIIYNILLLADLPLWQQTDGAIEWVQEFLTTHRSSVNKNNTTVITLPDMIDVNAHSAAFNDALVLGIVTSSSSSAKENTIGNRGIALSSENSTDSSNITLLSSAELHTMYAGMFNTALEMIRDTI